MNYQIDTLLEQSVIDSQDLLTNLLISPNIEVNLSTVFGNTFNLDRGLSEIESLVENDFSNFPQLEVRPGRQKLITLRVLYSISNNTIYLAQEFVTENASNIDAITKVIIEEIGHYIDFKANIADAPGDEGAIFRFIGDRRRFKQLPAG